MSPGPSAHPPRPNAPGPRRPPARLYKVLIVAVAAIAPAGLYFLFGRNDPLPPWITLPPDSRLLVSRLKPAAHRPPAPVAQVQYYLQARFRCDPHTALTHCLPAITGVDWDSPQPRPTRQADLFQRAAWPQWVRDLARRLDPPDVRGGFALSSTNSPSRLYLFAWPSGNDSIVELVLEEDTAGDRF